MVGCHFYDQIPRLDGVNGGSRRFNERYWNSEFLELSIEGEFITSRLKKEKENSAMAKHGFNRAIFKKSPLFELTKNNLEEKIFNVFDELKRKGGMPLTPN